MKTILHPTFFRLKALMILFAVFVFSKQSYAQAPANDLCANAITLTSGTTCTNTAGTVANATFTAGPSSLCSGGTVKYDVWYKFTAQSTNPTITLSSIGANFSAQAPRIQIFSGTCGTPVNVGCNTTILINAPGTLTVGTTYLVRVFSITLAAVPSTLATFNICITDPAPPANDNCAGATLLATGTGCSNTAGDLLNSKGTAGVPGDCGAVGSPEVWYKFVAQSAFPTITLSSPGAQLTAAGSRIQLLSGSCGSWTSLACVTSASLNTFVTPGPASPLTIGATYYIRIYTNSAVMTGAPWTFNICITEQAIVDYGKAYVNITKGASGGTVEPGDVLEIRAIYVVKGGTTTLASFKDTVPTNTTYVANTLRILTNEAQLYKQWTDATDADPAQIVAGSFISINLGAGATNAFGGTVKNTDKPTNFGSTCIMIVSYRVKVNAGATYGVTTINVGGGKVTYTNPNTYISNINFPSVNAMVYKNFGICVNTIGSNGVLSESGGTFGSGNPKDRSTTSSKIPVNYSYVPFSGGNPVDYFYGISNNSSSGGVNYSIIPNDPIAATHVFNVWDIIGDHTGAASPTAGNPPADTTGGKTGGYMVVINAAFRTDTAFLDTVKNLCPNTYYEYSAWFRNICKKCSGDSLGRAPSNALYVPTGPGDSSGVHPNLTFNINGFDYYSTGDILYTGQWIKKGFTYLTGPAQTQMIISIRNNAPGGGGNDWAIDDIGVATCTPNLVLNPSTPTINVCYGDGASLSADVKSFFNNYTEYIWERSINNGTTWTNTGFSGTGTPVFNGTEYVYTATGPSFIGDSTTNLNIFRLRVASSATNITDPNCSFAANRTVLVFVHSCMFVLKTELLDASGTLKNKFATIQWQTAAETNKVNFEIEKSTDGTHFTAIGHVNGKALSDAGASYTFNDPGVLNGATYYRIKMIEGTGYKYSKIILLSPDKIYFQLQNVVNPFINTLSFDVILPGDGDINTTILDNYGRAVKTYTQKATKGIVPLKIQDIHNLSSGVYTLKVEWQNESIIKRIIKTNN
jgi:trimeric autotransporter adhesin